MKTAWLIATLVLVLTPALFAVAHGPAPGTVAAPESAASAAGLFSRRCAKCHGRDGRARIKNKVKGTRNLADPQWQDRVSDERIFNVISNGKGRMPGFGKKLSEAEVDSLVQYVRGLKR